jgi:RNA polymerase sigma-70 factor (ECF subfamily)
LALLSFWDVPMIAFKCSRCDRKLTAQDELAGKQAKCPACGQSLPVPRGPDAGRPEQRAVGQPVAGLSDGSTRRPDDSASTSVSLLQRLRQPAEEKAWVRFVDFYTPFLFSWARHNGLKHADAADLVQDVFLVLVRKLPEFEYEKQKSFRGWLRTVIRNKWREKNRHAVLPMDSGAVSPSELADPDGPDLFWDAEYRQRLVERALEVMRTDFQPTTWRACWEHVVCGKAVAVVATELGISVKAVYLAKSRVLRRLRKELAGLMD